MSKITYSKRNTKTTVAIKLAPHSVQAVWNRANALGINILRVRAVQNRNEITKGNTFLGFHKAKVSVYQQLANPMKPLHFIRPLPLGEDNNGMQVLQIADNLDVQNTLKAIDDFEIYTTASFLKRIALRFKFLINK